VVLAVPHRRALTAEKTAQGSAGIRVKASGWWWEQLLSVCKLSVKKKFCLNFLWSGRCIEFCLNQEQLKSTLQLHKEEKVDKSRWLI